MLVEGMRLGREQEAEETHMVYLALYIKEYIEWIKTFQHYMLFGCPAFCLLFSVSLCVCLVLLVYLL